ncbi:hypothetical protein PQR02_34900 [Paraburkholderia sediminicola]|uniref:Uncharacterized protein n=1 Tax=Paraburkholderia rhynchosiae TaxID=487049 RepID=A0ACC7N9T7_9BURK
MVLETTGVRQHATAADYAAFVGAVLRGDRLKPSAWQQWLNASVMVPKGEVVHLEGEPSETEPDIGGGLGWGVEPNRHTFFQWGKMSGVRAFVMGSVIEQAGVVVLTNSNRGLRLMNGIASHVLESCPHAHSCKPVNTQRTQRMAAQSRPYVFINYALKKPLRTRDACPP